MSRANDTISIPIEHYKTDGWRFDFDRFRDDRFETSERSTDRSDRFREDERGRSFDVSRDRASERYINEADSRPRSEARNGQGYGGHHRHRERAYAEDYQRATRPSRQHSSPLDIPDGRGVHRSHSQSGREYGGRPMNGEYRSRTLNGHVRSHSSPYIQPPNVTSGNGYYHEHHGHTRQMGTSPRLTKSAYVGYAPPPLGYPQKLSPAHLPPVTTGRYYAEKVRPPKLNLKPYSTGITCPRCHTDVTTQVSYTPGWFCIILCVLIALCGGIFGCCLIPLCIEACQDADHRCPNCGVIVGTYRRGESLFRPKTEETTLVF